MANSTLSLAENFAIETKVLEIRFDSCCRRKLLSNEKKYSNSTQHHILLILHDQGGFLHELLEKFSNSHFWKTVVYYQVNHSNSFVVWMCVVGDMSETTELRICRS